MTEDRERLRSAYAAALVAHFGDRALDIARAQAESATDAAAVEWAAIVELLAMRGTAD